MSPQITLTMLVPGQHVNGLHRRLNESVILCPLLPIWVEEPLQELVQIIKELGLMGIFWELWGRLKCV